MDVTPALVGVACFIVSAVVLLFMTMFGMKEKSYEEALAEQRQQANVLLGTHTRPKSKEKKVKKANKKGKEKQPPVSIESETAEESEDTESPSSSTSSASQPHQKLHVEFKEPTVIEEVPVAEIHEKHSSSRKEDTAVKAEHVKEKASKPKQNGAEQESSKEKGQKARQNSLEGKENRTKQSDSTKDKKENQPEPVKDKMQKEKQSSSPDIQKQKKISKPSATQPMVEKEEPAVDIVSVVPQANEYVATTGKEKKKKKSEFNTLQHLSGAKDGDVNLSLLLNVVRKAELSRSEVQILIDLLLNKQLEAPAGFDEWSEGKADPIQKLKKQLAEKEKALLEEQEASSGAKAKLREIRAEQTAEKSQLQQKVRGMEEALQAKHLELQTANNRIHTQNQKIQQMQTQLNEESLTLRKLRDEIAALQLQRQQIDMHMTQAQEAEATIQDLQSRNSQLTLELHSITEQNMSAKEHIVQLQHQVNHFKTELDDKENFARQFEDVRRDLEHRLGVAHRQENELKIELSQLKSVCQQNTEEIRRLEHGKGQAVEEARNLQKQKDELDHTIAQLRAELRDMQAEISEIQVLKANGVSQENQSHKEELLNLHNELSSVKSELQGVEKKYTAELDASKNTLKQLQNELDEQKNKNNELRKKNWKVMDALKAAENKTLDTTKKSTVDLDEITSKIRMEEQESNKKFIQRLFPDIQILDSSYDQWAANVEKAIQRHVKSLETSKTHENQPEVAKLQAQVQHYKTIIDDTEGILKKLQNHIEQEEIHWRKELKTKESEIEALKQHHLSELQKKVQQLELKLNTEQEEKQKVTEAYELLKSRSSSQVDPAIIEKLSEEVNRLNEQLFIEKRKNSEMQHSGQETNDVCIKEQNSNSTNGPSIQANSN